MGHRKSPGKILRPDVGFEANLLKKLFLAAKRPLETEAGHSAGGP